jgi:nucleoside phosphorylase
VADITISDPCILFALGREAHFFFREFRPHQRFSGAPCWARFCGPSWLSVFVLRTGIGAARVRKAIDWLASEPKLDNVPYSPRMILSAGYSGALRDDLKVGDMILATEVVDASGGCWATTWPEELPSGEWRPPLIRGRVVTTPQLLGDPARKAELGAKHEALAADMEAAVAARYCHRAGIPFGCLRVISDEMRTPLSPDLVSLVSSGWISPVRVLGALARSPRLLGQFWRLARATRYASVQLSRALGELLTLTLPWGAHLG